MTPSRVRAVLAVVLGASVAGHVAAARSWGPRRAVPFSQGDASVLGEGSTFAFVLPLVEPASG
ncbi:hypothetical protein [Nocardioides dongkuii]|uniref:hypothetical protein n=1 Tax=Nocardioides dongkuii TaxID=2760089 RepID=UPI0018780CE6|nr:hypothetical protein [Nocardioides dongkuii]